MEIKKLLDAELVQALRCCGSMELGCKDCPIDRLCTNRCGGIDKVMLEASDRLEKLSRRLDSAAGMILRLDDERRRAGG